MAQQLWSTAPKPGLAGGIVSVIAFPAAFEPVNITALTYPGSFLKLLLAAFGVVSLPLLLAAGAAALFVESATEQSRNAVAQAAQAARGSRLLMEHTTGMERAARQYLILGDAALIEDYERLRAQFKSLTSELSLLPLDEEQLAALNGTIDHEQSLYEKLPGKSAAAERKALTDGYGQLSALAQGMLSISNALIDREVEKLTLGAQHAKRRMLWMVTAALGLGVLLAAAVTLLIARPVRQIESAVQDLGAGKFDEAIAITGPADLRHLGARLDWLRRRLAEFDHDRELFLRHASHELKTPLTAVREGAELLADHTLGTLSPAQQEVADIIRSRSRHLQVLIERLLEYQRARQGLAELASVPLQLRLVVERVVADQQLAAAARNIRVECALYPAMVMGDAEKLRVVVDNLLSNALKYSPVGGTVALRLAPAGDQVQLEVRDHGPGIPPSERDDVFDWFFRGSGHHGGRVPGTGIGLAIAREIVVAHRGIIELAGDVQPGACFRITLPAA